MRLIHLGTVVQSTFAWLDDDGNIVGRPGPLTGELPIFSESGFHDLFAKLRTARDQMSEPSPPPTEATP